jgi:hypothetical protein
MTKYLARYGVIHTVEVERETEKMVFYRSSTSGQLCNEYKQTQNSSWHDTWDEAKDALLARKARRFEKLRLELAGIEMDVERIRAMRPEIAQRG